MKLKTIIINPIDRNHYHGHFPNLQDNARPIGPCPEKSS